MFSGSTGTFGWVGEAVVLLQLGLDVDGSRVVARAALSATGEVEIDAPGYRAQWTKDGIVGRASSGRLYPADGQAFLDELPYVYRGAYLRAVPEDELFGGVE